MTDDDHLLCSGGHAQITDIAGDDTGRKLAEVMADAVDRSCFGN